MTDPRLALILATGGTGLVTAAYSSGTPAIGVGPGNVPVFIDRSADIPFAVESIIISKTFDNGTVCASEQSIVIEKSIEEEVVRELEKQGCYMMSPEKIEKVSKVAVNSYTNLMSAEVVGQPASVIANLACIDIPRDTKVLIAKLDGVGPEFPLSQEVLAPILAFFIADDNSLFIFLSQAPNIVTSMLPEIS